jgi:hypothetical protein
VLLEYEGYGIIKAVQAFAGDVAEVVYGTDGKV